ncbi:MAG: protease inhibitor I42 family protein [Eubacteriales bacterium]|nr:protease inhibitor I42 family protein [Eubacteriales bacterium]
MKKCFLTVGLPLVMAALIGFAGCAAPAAAPTAQPSNAPTAQPGDAPTAQPSDAPTDAPTQQPEGEWAVLNGEESVLTVSLPANPSTGYEWSYHISDTNALVLDKAEYTQDDAGEGVVGAGGTWVASFEGTFKQAGNVELTLQYGRSWEVDVLETRVLKLFINESNTIEVLSAEIIPAENDAK